MSLCMRCGKVYEHAKGCPEVPAQTFDPAPQAKNERALAALGEAQAALEEAKPLVESAPREAAKALFRIETLLTRHPSGDLTSFEHKRNYKALEESLKKVKAEVQGKLGNKGDEIFGDLAYAKRGLELLHAVHLRRREISSVKLDELAQVPGLGFDPKEANDPTDPGSAVRTACEVIEKRLATTSGVDDDVDQWGKSYVESLSLGEAPREFPKRLMPSLVIPQALFGTALLGAALAAGAWEMRHDVTLAGAIGAFAGMDALVGVVFLGKALSLRREAPRRFEELSQSFRLRLYLVAVDRSLRRYVSALSQAEEGLRTHTSGDQAARWKRIRTQEKDVIKFLAGETWQERHTADEEMARQIGAANLVTPDAVKSANALPREVWDGLGKAYFLNRREEDGANEGWLAALATAVLEHAGQRDDVATARKQAATNARSSFAGRTTQRAIAAPDI